MAAVSKIPQIHNGESVPVGRESWFKQIANELVFVNKSPLETPAVVDVVMHFDWQPSVKVVTVDYRQVAVLAIAIGAIAES